MAQKDLHNHVKTYSALNIQEITTDTTTVGNIIDTLLYESVEFVIHSGTLDATTVFTPKIEYGDDAALSDAADVPLNYTIGTTNITGERPDYDTLTADTVTPSNTPIEDATFTGVAESNITKRIGYVGRKRYVRLSEVTTLKTTGGTISAVCVLSDAHVLPTPKDE